MALDSNVYGYIVDPLLSIVDDAGLPVKNGYVIVCQAGTSTRINTYANWDGTYNSYKIATDLSGRLVNPAIVPKAGSYKIIVCDAEHGEENPIREVDNVYAIGASVTNTGTVTQGLNAATAVGTLVGVSVSGNTLRVWSTLENEDIARKTEVSAETSARTDADTALVNRINLEASTRSSADTALGVRINNEASARTEADNALGGRIDSEAAAREDADNSLDTRVSDLETIAETVATQSDLSAAVAAEAEARESADANLTAAVESLNTNLSDEVNARRDAVQNVSEAVQSEATSRANADSGLDSRITAIAAKIPAEASANNQLADKAFIAATYPTFTTAQREALNSGADVNKINQIETNRVTIAANNEQVGRDLATKANSADVTASLALKADKSTTYTKEEVDSALVAKADVSYVDSIYNSKESSSFNIVVGGDDVIETSAINGFLIKSGEKYKIKVDTSASSAVQIFVNGSYSTYFDSRQLGKYVEFTASSNITSVGLRSFKQYFTQNGSIKMYLRSGTASFEIDSKADKTYVDGLVGDVESLLAAL